MLEQRMNTLSLYGQEGQSISPETIGKALAPVRQKLRHALPVPPDFTRFQCSAGLITRKFFKPPT